MTHPNTGACPVCPLPLQNSPNQNRGSNDLNVHGGERRRQGERETKESEIRVPVRRRENE
eukprot:433775-Rhodomonas_salina.1